MRIIIADDHAIFRDGLKLLLAGEPGWQIVGETGDVEGLRRLAGELLPDLVLMDYNMPGGEAGAALDYLKHRHPTLRVVVLTAERAAPLLRHLAEAGADGILLKEGSAQDLLAALRAVADGQRVLPDNVRERLADCPENLTRREQQILRLICNGWTNGAIADHLSLSPRTVDKHRENIQRKLGVGNAVQLANKARELQLV